ncbi:hypothetical protein AB0K49_01885 [Streptomyces decoyicus]|uniref:hypothetical protein n=1 Tax=Streptomyces decoyicus TaxID=249567 RepID=UPI00345CFCF0
MSAVLALPAAVRLPRTVAVRRALLAGLFLVGFVALGFAFGPGAHADDRTRTADLPGASTPAGPAAEASTPDRAATRDGAANRLSGSGAAIERQGKASGAKLAERTHSASDAVAGAVRPAAEQVAPATGRITEPVSRVVREIGESAGAGLPVHLPSGEHAERPGDGSTHPHGRTPGEAQSAGQGTAATAGGAAAAQSSHCAADVQESAAGHRPAAVHEQQDPGHHDLPGQCPQAPMVPTSHTAAGDGHGPRGGDQHTTAPVDPLRFRLLPGGVRTADGAPTRRRAEEILEFPG